MITPPKLPKQLDETRLAIGPGVSCENTIIASGSWGHTQAARASFDTVRLMMCDLSYTSLREATLIDVAAEGGEWNSVDLTAASLRRVSVASLGATGLIMAEAKVRDVSFKDTKLKLANLRFANLSHVLFQKCDLTECDFAGATLTNVDFQDCLLPGANFSSAICTKVNLTSSRLENIAGVDGLRGCTITSDQLPALAPSLAAHLGIHIS